MLSEEKYQKDFEVHAEVRDIIKVAISGFGQSDWSLSQHESRPVSWSRWSWYEALEQNHTRDGSALFGELS